MAGRPGIPADFASSSLLALAVQALRRQDPGLLPDAIRAPDPLDRGRLPSDVKRHVLDIAHARGGPGPILSVGLALPGPGHSPTLDVLTASADASALAARWMRLERYHHARNRTRLTRDGDSLAAQRHAETGPPPTEAETLLIAGLLAGLLIRIGATNVTLAFGETVLPATAAGYRAAAGLRAGTQFRLAWTGIAPVAPTPSVSGDGLRTRLAALMAGDPAHGWRIAEAARTLAVSARGLQRALSREGSSFTLTLRAVRLAEAARLLTRTAAPLAEIGYCCGYADQAHFQRDFVRVMNVTPARFRELGAA